MKREPRARWLAALLFVLTFAAYGPAFRAGFIWDDDAYVTRNETLGSLDGLRAIWTDPSASPQYYPLVFTSFWMEHRLWGLRPIGYHIVNVLLHALNAVLVLRLLALLAVPGAWWAAAVFALHPVHVESVAWVTERKNVLSMGFMLLACLAYLRFSGLAVPPPAGAPPSSSRPRRWRLYGWCVASFAAALLSKTVTCVFPLVLALLLFWKRQRLRRADLVPIIPLLILGAALAATTIVLEHRYVHAELAGGTWRLSPADRWLIAGRALWFYAGKLFWPHPLSFMYPRWHVDPASWWQWGYPLGALAVWGLLWMARRRIGAGPFVAVTIFVVAVAPALGFIDFYPMRYAFVADHFQYLGSLGLTTLAAGGAAGWIGRRGRRWARVGALLGIAGLGGLGVLTWRQALVYRDEQTLWMDAVRNTPSSSIAHNNLGRLLEREGREADAMACYLSAIRFDPENAEAHNNLGIVLAQRGRSEEAKARYLQALRLGPGFAEAHNNLGNLLLQLGQDEDALAHLQQAARLKPRFAKAHYNVGVALTRAGRLREAAERFRTAVRLDPGLVEARHNLGVVLAQQGDLDAAVEQFKEVLRLRPDSAEDHDSLGMVLAQLGRSVEANAHFTEALRLQPAGAEAPRSLDGPATAPGLRGERKSTREPALLPPQ